LIPFTKDHIKINRSVNNQQQNMSLILNSVTNLPTGEELQSIERRLVALDGRSGRSNHNSFRVSNNAKDAKGTGEGFSKKFVEHGCYSITPGFLEWNGHKSRMRQHKKVEIGDVLYLSESRKNNRVYRGIVLTKFKKHGPTNPSFYAREDVRNIAAAAWCRDDETFQAWLEESNEYICRVQWSEAREIDKTALNSGYIAATIVPRKETAIALANQFAGAGRE
jgi:hypothetical protein